MLQEGKEKKSKEQLEAEKKAILKQRIVPLSIDGLDQSGLTEKAKELHKLITRLEGEKYDLEKRFKTQQVDVSIVHAHLTTCNQLACDSQMLSVLFNIIMHMCSVDNVKGSGKPLKHGRSRDFCCRAGAVLRWGKPESCPPPSLCLQQQYAVVKPAVIQGAFFGGLDWLIW